MRLGDLFAVGLGFDFAGAYLLGRGLLTSPATILERSTPRMEFHRGLAIGQAEDRADGLAGTASLLGGFAIQAVGYAVALHSPGTKGSVVDAVLLGVIALAVAGGLVAVWDRLLRRRVLWRILIELARFDEARQRHSVPSAVRLQDFGMALGIGGTEAEVVPGGPPLYAHRVFGVKETR